MDGIRIKGLDVESMFDFCAVLDAIGLEQLFETFDKEDMEKIRGLEQKEAGILILKKVSTAIIKNIPKAKSEICEFLAGCIEKEDGTKVTAQEVRKMNAMFFVATIRDLFRQEGIQDFFKDAAELQGTVQGGSKNSATGGMVMPMGT